MVMLHRLVIALGLLGLLSACPAMSPVGAPSNPAGVVNTEKTDAADNESPSVAADLPADATNRSLPSPSSGAGGDSPAIPISNPISNPSGGGSSSVGNTFQIAQGGTFNPKGDGESVGSDPLKDATDWRLRLGVNAWWELSRTKPETYPVFKNSTTDFKMKLEFLNPDAGYWILAGPTPNGTPMVHLVYQPKGQSPESAQSLSAPAGFVQAEGHNVSFLNLTLGEGTVTFTVEYAGVTHPLGSLITYFSDADASSTSVPAFH
jgi:hypothetical protein